MEKNWLSKTNQQKWYAPHQRFSIRKYHFGAASVLLGVALALTGGAEASANTADTGSSTTPSSAVEATSSTTNVAITSTESTAPVDSSIASATTETVAATPVQERVATINIRSCKLNYTFFYSRTSCLCYNNSYFDSGCSHRTSYDCNETNNC